MLLIFSAYVITILMLLRQLSVFMTLPNTTRTQVKFHSQFFYKLIIVLSILFLKRPLQKEIC